MCKAFEDAEIKGTKEMTIRTYKEIPTISLETLAKLANASVETIKSWILGAGLPLR